MTDTRIDFSHLTPAQRLTLIGQIWDSLEPPPESPELLAELDRRSAEAESDPNSGRSWEEIKAEFVRRVR